MIAIPKNLERDERIVGLSAISQSRKNIRQTYQYFSRFLGLTHYDTDVLENEKQFISNNIDIKNMEF